jgi:hypothetical protein
LPDIDFSSATTSDSYWYILRAAGLPKGVEIRGPAVILLKVEMEASFHPMSRGVSRTRPVLGSSRFVVWLLAAGLAASTLSASTIVISANGRFTKTTPVSPFSGPGDTWSLSFDVDNQPTVYNVNPGNYFDVDFSDFTYLLNGDAVAIAPVDIRFFSGVEFGGFNVCFDVACSFFNSPEDGLEIEDLDNQQLYQGPTSAPTIITGSFPAHSFDLFVNSEDYIELDHPTIVSQTAVTTPEPSAAIPLGAAMLLLAWTGRRSRKK